MASDSKRHKVMVINAPDIQNHLLVRHQVFSLEALPVVGFAFLDAVVISLERKLAHRIARQFRSELVEPVLIHDWRSESSDSFLALCRQSDGRLSFGIFDEVLAHAIAATALQRKLRRLSGELRSEAPTTPTAARNMFPYSSR